MSRVTAYCVRFVDYALLCSPRHSAIGSRGMCSRANYVMSIRFVVSLHTLLGLRSVHTSNPYATQQVGHVLQSKVKMSVWEFDPSCHCILLEASY